MACYEIAFSGQLVPGAQLELVKANLAKLFQADEQRLALLFSGRRIVIKSNLDAAGAEKYRSTLERAGALIEVVDLDQEIEEIELAPPPADPVAGAGASREPVVGRLQVAPRDEYMAAFAEVEVDTETGLVTVLGAINVGTFYFFMGAFGSSLGWEPTFAVQAAFVTGYRFSRQAAFFLKFVPLLEHGVTRFGDGFGLGVVQPDLAARLCGDLGNAPAHGAGANDGDFGEGKCHVGKVQSQGMRIPV